MSPAPSKYSGFKDSIFKNKRRCGMVAAIQICGTASGAGKSVLVSALCRIFLQDGFRVSPFKAQNMSLNSFVTKDGLEMGRAQVTQAQACRILPNADMNPVLLKPASDVGAQVIVQGEPIGNKTARQYQNGSYKEKLFKKVKESFNRLRKEYDIVVIEGAGSPAEINLKRHDIVNMRMAGYAKAPVILAGDIDKGGVFASLLGTVELLDRKERDMVRGFIINKFRGDKSLIEDAITFLEKKTKKPVLGVVPYFKDINIPEEDSVFLESAKADKAQSACLTGSLLGESEGRQAKQKIEIAVIKLPHISNFTDFDSLENESDVRLRYISNNSEIDTPDIIIIPGTKNTIKDLVWLKQSGLADKILFTINNQPAAILIGICGGYQMLGRRIYDTHKIESERKEIQGLGLLPIITHLGKEKLLSQVKAKEISSGLAISGYEIHHGITKSLKDASPLFKIIERFGKKADAIDGVISDDKRIMGSYIHGVFDAAIFRRDFLNRARRKQGLPAIRNPADFNLDIEFDKLAQVVRKNINMGLIYKMIEQKP